MLFKFLLASILTTNITGFLSINPRTQNVRNILTSVPKTPSKINPASLHSLTPYASCLRLSAYDADGTDSFCFILLEVLYDIIDSQLELHGDGIFVFDTNSKTFIITDEFHRKVTEDLDSKIEKFLPKISPEMPDNEKSLLKEALKWVSKSDIREVVDDLARY